MANRREGQVGADLEGLSPGKTDARRQRPARVQKPQPEAGAGQMPESHKARGGANGRRTQSAREGERGRKRRQAKEKTNGSAGERSQWGKNARPANTRGYVSQGRIRRVKGPERAGARKGATNRGRRGVGRRGRQHRDGRPPPQARGRGEGEEEQAPRKGETQRAYKYRAEARARRAKGTGPRQRETGRREGRDLVLPARAILEEWVA